MSKNPRLTNNQTIINTSPEQKQTTYTYDKQRRVTQVTKPSSKTIDTTYTNGRVTSIQTDEGTTNYSYACQSNISQISKGSESFSFTYDGTLVTSIVQSGLLNQTVAYTYNNDFIPTSVTYAGASTNYLYNKDNELVRSGDFNVSRVLDYGIKKTLTDGIFTQESDYNLYGELTEQIDGLFAIKLYRNKNGQITKKVETLDGNVSTYTYQYDDRSRLTAVRLNRKLVEKYTYDANGNRLTATSKRRNILNQLQSYNADDQISLIGQLEQTYDVDGYLKTKVLPSGETYQFSYGTMGELLEVVTPSKTITYKHNANNQRVSKEVNGTVVEKYLWANLTTLLAIYDANDNLVQRFEYADNRMPVAMTQGSTKYYLHYDQVGSLRAVTDTSHTIVKEIVYDTFGNILNDTNPSLKVPFGFAGGLYDSDTQLTRFGYRDYDAYTGKWTAKDPIGFDGGDSNLYGYVLGDPVDLVDPTGKISIQEGMEDVIQTGMGNSLGGYNASKEARNYARESRLPGSTNGKQDAYRHCVWNCIMTRKIGKSAARRIANNHEKHGGIDNQPKMDKCNNLSGRSTAGQKGSCPNLCMQLLKNGDLYVLPKEMWR